MFFFPETVKIPEILHKKEFDKRFFNAIYNLSRRNKSDYFWSKALDFCQSNDLKVYRVTYPEKSDYEIDIHKSYFENLMDFFDMNKQELFTIIYFEMHLNHSIYGLKV